MDIDGLKMLLASADRPKFHAAARDLGRNLAAPAVGDWLVKARRVVTRIQKGATDDYDRGFLEALELVATGFDRQATETRVDESEIVRIKARAHWLVTLRLLEHGAQRPTDLVEHLGIGKSHATKLIDELEDAELVTRVVEGKERPCHLTSRARLLLEKLPEEKAPSLEDVVPAIVECMGTMSRDRRVGRDRLLTMIQLKVRSKAAPRILDIFAKSLHESLLGFLDDDDALVATETELQTRLAHHLTLACAGKQTPMIDRLAALTKESDVILRVPPGIYEWDVVATTLLPGVRVLSDADLGQSYSLPWFDKKYQLVYGSPALLSEDLRQGREAIVQKADGRYYFGVDSTPAIKDFMPIEISMPGFELTGVPAGAR